MKQLEEWEHVFKLDPAKEISDEQLEQLCESGTDAVIVGGTDSVTEDNTLDLLMRIRRFSVSCVLEVSGVESLVPGFDYYLVPSVLNARSVTWVTGLHHRALKEFGHLIGEEELIAEGYCVLNPEAKVAYRTDADTMLDADDVVAYARLTDQLFRMPVFYMEYSGAYGDPELVRRAANVLENARLFYGGGIASPEQASEMAALADVVIVGNVIYDDFKAALKTVAAVKAYTKRNT
ncbi:heptaprenylglyceryl phosphate synthase [Alkalicoccus luteus]|uniref:Heptaprenylglyceryl phosphate synthase n=1 Tax=Alkalicoccus luteus TaxID=1237094 RepID=A0A969PU20_9BACI|nr:heptaprenylglyceryl phosphate synthase [Alkalicoccus luteus]NJP38386.1 heptaprenylglyceryl phosphate synthase [Alkalicoccus luteus]